MRCDSRRVCYDLKLGQADDSYHTSLSFSLSLSTPPPNFTYHKGWRRGRELRYRDKVRGRGWKEGREGGRNRSDMEIIMVHLMRGSDGCHSKHDSGKRVTAPTSLSLYHTHTHTHTHTHHVTRSGAEVTVCVCVCVCGMLRRW